MRQKFEIYLDDAEALLRIRELAVIDNHLNSIKPSMLEDKSFCLLCEMAYDQVTITNSMSAGVSELVMTLRTANFFPNQQYATKIAEAIVKLFDSAGDDRIELFFDDKDMMDKSLAISAAG
jgi:hypothetical protein